MTLSLEAIIEALLLWHNEPMSLKDLARATGQSAEAITTGLQALEQSLENRGAQLLRKADEVMLGSHPEASQLIEKLTKEELSRDLGKASLETLTIILYQGPISRAKIDYLRGVNSSFILRHLMIRGLVERVPNPEDARAFLYRATFDLLQNLGVTRVEDLPDYATLTEKL